MKIPQLSLFVENRPGQLVGPCRILAEAGIDIKTLSLADTEQFGILRLIVDRPEPALAALTTAGYVVRTTEVLALEVADRPGGLAELLALIEANGLTIEYMYAFTYGGAGRAVMVFRFEDVELATERLAVAGIEPITAVALMSHGHSNRQAP